MGVLFDSVTDSLTASTFTVPTTGTLGFKFYPNWAQTDNLEHVFFDIRNAGPTNVFNGEKFVDNKLYVGWYTGGVDYRAVVASASYTLNQSAWNTFCATWDGAAKSFTLYLNGTQIGTGQVDQATWNTSAETLSLGNPLVALANVDGRMGEFAFWNRILTGAELTSFNSGLLASCIPTPTSYWPLNTIADLTDHADSKNLTNANVTDAPDHPVVVDCNTSLGGTAPTLFKLRGYRVF